MIYEKGTIKVVWITDGEEIYAHMFESEADAVQFAQDKEDYLIFRLLREKNMEEFTWKLLPYGRAGLYKILLAKRNVILNLLGKE
jgi:hypothetical protein